MGIEKRGNVSDDWRPDRGSRGKTCEFVKFKTKEILTLRLTKQ